MKFERPQLGRRFYQPKSSTCCICKKPVIHISVIQIKGNTKVRHCEACKKAAEEYADTIREDMGLI